ncbi:hypothetical protein GGQ84_001618 [Desulfitispora alkaliphila]|uniref:hypothetical protein n=1 Tax=Desulfitispora alkaliphila TaxID=622674 RepID=UPI003D23B4BB
MKKTFTVFLLIIAMLAMPFSVYAADETSRSMSVVFEYTAPEPEPDPEPDPDPEPPADPTTYIIEIPATVTNGNMEHIPITASKNTIDEGKMVTVSVDWDKSYDSEGYFYLFKNKGLISEELILCRVLLYLDDNLTEGVYVDYFETTRDRPLVKFLAGDTTPSYGGVIGLRPITQYSSASSGTYTGTLYFNIQVVDAD